MPLEQPTRLLLTLHLETAEIFAAGMLSATPVVRRGMRTLAPLKNLSGFGMTETWLGATLSLLDDDEAHRSEASGWPGLGYELRIVDDGSGEVLGPGVAGELQVDAVP
jgi:fatty-acyl-CoA synthase